jgi:hypothetical protein
MLQNWSYGVLTQIIGTLTILASVLVFYRAEDGGLIAFILGFINIAPSLFFIGRSSEIQDIVSEFVITLQDAGYSLVSSTYVFAIGFVIDLIGTVLLPASSILIISNATRLRTTKPRPKTELPQEERPNEQQGLASSPSTTTFSCRNATETFVGSFSSISTPTGRL